MRIFYAVEYEPWPGSKLWYNNFYLSLLDLGHQVVVLDYPLGPHYAHCDLNKKENRKFIKANRSLLEKKLLNQVKEEHKKQPLDLFFSYFNSAFVRPDIIREIRQMGIITVNWYCNASYQFDLVKDIAPAYDYCLVPEKYRLQDYKRAGANPIYCQEAANPKIYKPYPLKQEFPVTFIGMKYGDRPHYISRLFDAGVPIRVWGKGWEKDPEEKPRIPSLASRICKLATIEGWRRLIRKLKKFSKHDRSEDESLTLPPDICGPPLDDPSMIQMYSRSKISLGFSNVGDTHKTANPIKQIRLRDFEVPMSGAFYMVQHMEELEEFFQIGKEIVCYHNPSDLVEKVKYYLAHDTERKRIRRAGYQRAIRDHTWQKRLTDVFKTMGLQV